MDGKNAKFLSTTFLNDPISLMWILKPDSHQFKLTKVLELGQLVLKLVRGS